MLCFPIDRRGFGVRALTTLGAATVWMGVVGVNSAAAQLSPQDIEALQEQGIREGWTFTVGENPATKVPLENLCGLVEPPDWREKGSWDDTQPRRGLPDAFDWRDSVTLPPVENQGSCGSCWAFATTGPLECNIKIHDGITVDLSEQWLVSCNSDGWDCGGGWWAHNYHEWKDDPCGDDGAVLEQHFPYVAYDAPCNCPYPHDYWIADWHYIGSSSGVPSVDAMKQAIYDHGPISVAVYANTAMQSYSGGIFNGCSNSQVNHGVTLVGWDDNQGSSGVWFMRNSWGTGWGEDGGYMRIPYGCSYIGYAAAYVEYAGTQGMAVTPTTGLVSEGEQGGPFTPSSKVYTVQNIGDTGFTYVVTKDQPWISLTNANGYLAPYDSTTVTVSINGVANGLAEGHYDDFVAFTCSLGIGNTTRDVDLTVGIPQVVYEWNLNTNPGWTTQTDWAFGQPTGGGGEYGYADPTSGHTGSNVYGYNLSGDYPNDLSEKHLTTTAIDCSDLSDVHLKFWRRLGVEQSAYDHAYVRVSNNGSTWTTVWQNANEVTDLSWRQMEYDISSVADGRSTVYIRWTMGSTDGGWRYCGWNIDDIQIVALGGEPPVPTIEHQLIEIPISA
ncbi:MAG: choice-of-anchor J domain-containing protein, partial [Phycisphaerales bacterium]|nr:choice-of-anchor J domain-containing protein [Phycisphaerales bacterium]